MILLFTDFGLHGPYLGQVYATLWRAAPSVPVVNLFADAPAFDPRASAYLLAAYAGEFPESSVFLCVVDPGVGSAERRSLVIRAGQRWYVGPDNGLFQMVSQQDRHAQWWEITWKPRRLSASFHGRDLFAPVAARLALGEDVPGESIARPENRWDDDLAQIIYVDHYGNGITGIRASAVAPTDRLSVSGREIGRARIFSDVAPGKPLWYINSSGLVEVAVNCGRAADQLGLRIGDSVEIRRGAENSKGGGPRPMV